MLVTTDLFKLDTEIGQFNDDHIVAELQQAIDQYEPEYLNHMFGYSTAELLKAGFAVDPTVTPWLELKSGVVFTNTNFQSEKFLGLLAPGNSPIVYYIYYWYLRHHVSETTGGGEAIINKQNSRIVTNRRRQVHAWNRMVDLNYQIIRYMHLNPTVYPLFYTYSKRTDSYDHNNLLTKINLLNI